VGEVSDYAAYWPYAVKYYHPGSAEVPACKRKKETAEHDNIDIEQGKDNEVDATALQDNLGAEEMVNTENKMIHTTPATPAKRFSDNRKWCFRCTYKVRMGMDGRNPKYVSRVDGLKPRKPVVFACVVKWLFVKLVPTSA
jgi:hypothetical protein